MNDRTNEEVRGAVRDHYGKVAKAPVASGGCGCGTSTEGCGPMVDTARLGYSTEEMAAAPEGADLGLGCGNPQAIASLRPGETVLDLGSGGGFDCFLAARQVGATGRVIGVDMTPEMIARARANAAKVEARNVEFRLGEIERLPVADASVDVILSNCVINLSPEKEAVFREAFRVLRVGGRLAISDVVATAPMPEALARDVGALTGCVAGAASVADLERALRRAGFDAVRVEVNEASRAIISDCAPGLGAENYVASATIQAMKTTATAARADGAGDGGTATRPGGGTSATASACCAPSCCAPAGKPA